MIPPQTAGPDPASASTGGNPVQPTETAPPLPNQLTVLELVRLIAALALAVLIYQGSSIIALAFLPVNGDLVSYIGYLVLGLYLPALLAIALACLVPSWRYTTIAATIMVVTLAFMSFIEFCFALGNFWAMIGAAIQLSASLSGALAGAWFWQNLKDRHTAREMVNARLAGGGPPAPPANRQPTVSPVLLGLSLAAIPATYLTLFVAAFLAVGYSALLLMLLSALPSIPIVIVVAALLAPIVAAWASLRALWVIFFPKPPFQPAVEIDLACHPVTRTTIAEVCAAVNTRLPNHVILHAEPTFFVTQQKLRLFAPEPAVGPEARTTVKGRTLAIGMPLLPVLSEQEFKAVLAHEFAHFSGRDTLYSAWVGQVYRSLGESLSHLQRTRATASGALQGLMSLLILPSVLFLALFLNFFAAIDAIVSRARELRADWIAATCYGANAVTTALQKVVQCSAHFSGWTDQVVLEGIALESPRTLFRQHFAALQRDPAALQSYLDAAMNAVEHEFASHPSLRTRITNLPQSAAVPDQHPTANPIVAEVAEEEAHLSTAVSVSLHQLQTLVAQQRAPQTAPSA